jgi:phosphoglucomutase
MAGDYVRDKDAVTAAMLIAEMAAWYAGQNMTLYHAMEKLYEKYGQYGEKTLELQMPGLDGIAKMRELMVDLRDNSPLEIAGVKVIMKRDFLDGVETNVLTGETTPIELSGSNVLRFETEDGTVVLVRPSGTEPKVKVYIMTSAKTRDLCNTKINSYIAWVDTLCKIYLGNCETRAHKLTKRTNPGSAEPPLSKVKGEAGYSR